MKNEEICINPGCGMPFFHCECELRGMRFKSSENEIQTCSCGCFVFDAKAKKCVKCGTDRVSNTNEKAQSSSEFIIPFLRSSRDFPHTSNYHEFTETITAIKVTVEKWMELYAQYRILKLECDLAKSQEKCSKYEGALREIVADGNRMYGIGDDELSPYDIAEQALKA